MAWVWVWKEREVSRVEDGPRDLAEMDDVG